MSIPKKYKIIGASRFKTPNESRLIIIDESQTKLDELATRTIFACVEIDGTDSEKIDSTENQIKDQIKKLNISKKNNKLHITDLSQDEKNKLINTLSYVDFTAKVWIMYSQHEDPHSAKIKALEKCINGIRKKHSKKNISLKIECADEYKKHIPPNLLLENDYLSILPDICCYIMRMKLDKDKILEKIDSSSDPEKGIMNIEKNIEKIHEKIRLQVIYCENKTIELAREDRV